MISEIGKGQQPPGCCGVLTKQFDQVDWHRVCSMCGQHYWEGQAVLERKALTYEHNLVAARKAEQEREALALKDYNEQFRRRVDTAAFPTTQWNGLDEINALPTFETVTAHNGMVIMVEPWVTKQKLAVNFDKNSTYTLMNRGGANPPWMGNFDGIYQFRETVYNGQELYVIETDLIKDGRDRFWGVYSRGDFDSIEQDQQNVLALPRAHNVWYGKTPGQLVRPYQGFLSNGSYVS